VVFADGCGDRGQSASTTGNETDGRGSTVPAMRSTQLLYGLVSSPWKLQYDMHPLELILAAQRRLQRDAQRSCLTDNGHTLFSIHECISDSYTRTLLHKQSVSQPVSQGPSCNPMGASHTVRRGFQTWDRATSR